MVKIGIILTEQDVGIFFRVSQEINKYVDDPETVFIFSDEFPIVARYLDRIKYRKCTIYHTGSAPKHRIGRYTNKNDFYSYAEINATIVSESDIIIDSKLWSSNSLG